MIFALAGNQNSGKTTLFNQLTGANQHVGNFPGVTVDKKEGKVRGHNATVVDLPGIYSLSPYTGEEIVTRDFLLETKPDGIINIVDATNLERNLYLSLQLIELNIPMVIALNMMDEMRQNKSTVDIARLTEELGVPIVPISASKNEGISELIEQAVKTAQKKRFPKRLDFCHGAVHRCIHAVAHLVEEKAQQQSIPCRFAASKLVEGDEPMQKRLQLTDAENHILQHTIEQMEQEVDTDREAAMADMRYDFIEKLCKLTVVKGGESVGRVRSEKIDAILTHKYFALPIFLVIMIAVFWLSFDVIGALLSDWLALGVDSLSAFVSNALLNYGINPVIHSLIINGAFAGVGSVLSFLPIIMVLFFFLSILEDTGYMARVAFVMDKLLRKLGLSGRSFVPMLIGFGCSVPAIMATRTLSSDRDRKMTILLTPFMSCSAKVPIYAVFTAAFFPNNGALVMIILYVLGMLLAVVTGLVLKSTLFAGKPVPFVMELPNYRMPGAKSATLLMWDKAKDFLVRAFTLIFLVSLVIWFLQSFDMRLNLVDNTANSMLADIGRTFAPVFAPLGFNDWRAATALVTGLTAKEAVVSTMAVLTGTSITELGAVLATIFTPLSAFCYMVFILLYTPCVAAIAAIKREMKSGLVAFVVVLAQTGIAWLVCFIIYSVGSLFL